MNIKEHVKKHKTKYAFVVGGVTFAGITAIIMRGRYAGVQRVPDRTETSVFVRPLSFLSNQTNDINIVTVLEREGRGHPGYRILDLTTMIDYDSQYKAAEALNTSASIVSGHLKGKLPDVNGHKLIRISPKENNV